MRFEDFLKLLNENGIEIVVDARSIPYSEHSPQFNRGNIENGLRRGGIGYVFVEDEQIGNLLGGRPRDEDCYINGKITYECIMGKEWYKIGIAELLDIAKKNKTAIMCSEEDPNKCHRHHLITQTLLNKNIPVFHIRRDGSIEEAQKEKIQVILPAYSS